MYNIYIYIIVWAIKRAMSICKNTIWQWSDLLNNTSHTRYRLCVTNIPPSFEIFIVTIQCILWYLGRLSPIQYCTVCKLEKSDYIIHPYLFPSHAKGSILKLHMICGTSVCLPEGLFGNTPVNKKTCRMRSPWCHGDSMPRAVVPAVVVVN